MQGRRRREHLARSIRQAVDSALADNKPALSAAVPVSRAAVLEARPALLALADDLEEIPEPDPRGVELALQLLCDGGGPLYRPWSPDDLRRAAEGARAAL
jgi:hypothetical protein